MEHPTPLSLLSKKSVKLLGFLLGSLMVVLLFSVSSTFADDADTAVPPTPTAPENEDPSYHIPYVPPEDMPAPVLNYESGEPADYQPVIVSQETLADGTTRTIADVPVIQDTYIASNFPNSNYGFSQVLFIGYDLNLSGAGAQRMYMQFDVSSLSNVQVNKAELWAAQSFCSPAGDAPMPAVIRHLNGPWDANTMTWSNASAPWGGIDAQGEIDCRGSGYGSADITNLVQQWVAGTRQNYGIMLQGDETPQERQRSWFSKESTSQPPYLRVDYLSCSDQTNPTSGMNPLPATTESTEFIVNWFGDDPAGIGLDHFDVQYRLQNKSDWREWKVKTQQTSGTFKLKDVPDFASGDVIEFRVRAVDKCGNAQDFPSTPQANTKVLTATPTASINPLPARIESNIAQISWTGNAQGNPPISRFDVEYRYNKGSWVAWQTGTQTSANFLANQDGFYQFRVRAYDANDRMGEWSNMRGIIFDLNGDVGDEQLFVPIVFK